MFYSSASEMILSCPHILTQPECLAKSIYFHYRTYIMIQTYGSDVGIRGLQYKNEIWRKSIKELLYWNIRKVVKNANFENLPHHLFN